MFPILLQLPRCISGESSTWTTVHHLKLHPHTTELLFIPGKDCPRMDLSVTVKDVFSFIDCEEPGHNPQWQTILHPKYQCWGLILQICPLQQHSTSTGSGLSSQRTQYYYYYGYYSLTTAIYSGQESKALLLNRRSMSRIHKASDLHWLPVEASIGSRQWYWPSRPSTELHPSTSKHRTKAQALGSTPSAGWLVPPSLRTNKGHSVKSRLFSVLAPQWWNKILTNVRIMESLSIFSKTLKTHLFRLHLDPT